MIVQVDIIESASLITIYVMSQLISEPTVAQMTSEQKSEASVEEAAVEGSAVEGSAVLVSTLAHVGASAIGSEELPLRGGVAYRDTDLDMLYKMIQDTPVSGLSTAGSSRVGLFSAGVL